MKKIGNSLIKLLFAIVFLVLAFASLVFLILEIINLDNENRVLAEEIFLKRAEESALEEMKKTLEESTAERQLINSFFVERNGEVEFIEFLENLAKDSGLSFEIQSVAVSDAGNPNFENLLVNASGRGTFVELYRFLTLIENANKATKLKNLSMKSVSTDKEVVWGITFEISALKVKSQKI